MIASVLVLEYYIPVGELASVWMLRIDKINKDVLNRQNSSPAFRGYQNFCLTPKIKKVTDTCSSIFFFV